MTSRLAPKASLPCLRYQPGARIRLESRESGDYPNSPPSSAVIILAIDIPESILPCIRLVTHLIRITAPQEQLRPLRRSLERTRLARPCRAGEAC